MSDERCEICDSDEVFRTRLWWRGCLECGSAHIVCGHCLDEWGLRLAADGVANPDGRLRHRDCPDAAAVARELMAPLAPRTAEQASRSGTARRAWANRKAKA